MPRINIEIDDSIHRKIKAHSAINGKTMTEYINSIIEKRLKKEKEWEE
ncbi:MAG: plasmid partition protein ParG [Nanobdellota archaeon]